MTDEEAAKHSPIVRETGGEVLCREVGAGEAPVGRTPEMAALLAAAESEFGGLFPRPTAEFGGGGVPDLDAY